MKIWPLKIDLFGKLNNVSLYVLSSKILSELSFDPVLGQKCNLFLFQSANLWGSPKTGEKAFPFSKCENSELFPEEGEKNCPFPIELITWKINELLE